MTRLSLGVVVGVLAACQPVEFRRVEPFAVAQTTRGTVVAHRALQPNVMLLLDTSGSMLLPLDPTAAECAPGCGSAGAPCAAGCATRSSAVKASLDVFLERSVTQARVGLTTFPADTACAPPSSPRLELPPPATVDDQRLLEARALTAREMVQAVQPTGGTPTAAALRFLGEMAALQDPADGREDFVVLLTDGLPNCNDAHPANTCGGTGACTCTVASCTGSLCSRGCLDDVDAVEAVRALWARGIRTVVVGFGAEAVTGDAPRVLGELAEAGGAGPVYSATNATELAEALEAVAVFIDQPPCEYLLDAAPSSPELISVAVDGVDVPPGAETWRYQAEDNRVIFSGALCSRLDASTPLAPVNLEFRVLEVL